MKKRSIGTFRQTDKVALIVLLAALTASLAACAGPAAAVTAAKPPPTATVPAPASAPTAPLHADAALGQEGADVATKGDRLYIWGNDPHGAGGLFELDSASGKVVRSLPGGFVAPGWSTLYTVEFLLNSTRLQAYDMASGKLLREATLSGRYDVPTAPDVPDESAFSPDGRTLVLFKQPIDPEHDPELKQWEATGKPRTRIALVDTSFKTSPRQIDLEGNFWFDAMGNNALYLLEILDKGWPPSYSPTQTPRYQVRRYDLAAGKLDPQPVVDKSDVEIMTGNRNASVGMSGGTWLFGLYSRVSEGPFVHVLNMSDAYAICLDLPFPASDFEQSMMWALALSPDERTLYAVNVALGQVAAIDTQSYAMRTATLPQPKAAAPSLLSRLADWLMPTVEAKRLFPAGAAVSPDGKTLYAMGPRDVVAISTGDLTLRGRFMDGLLLTSLVVAPGGDALYAVTMETGKLMRLGVATGSNPAQVDTPVRAAAVLRATEGAR